MKKGRKNCYDELKRVFHEPKRLAIVSELCAAESGLTFNKLKDLCDTSDGNLHRHLKMLEDCGVIKVEKEFVKRKPRTTIYVTGSGADQFVQYLDALARVLKQAKQSVSEEIPEKEIAAGEKEAVMV